MLNTPILLQEGGGSPIRERKSTKSHFLVKHISWQDWTTLIDKLLGGPRKPQDPHHQDVGDDKTIRIPK